MGGEESGRSALDRQRGGIAVLDSNGNVTWTDDRWAAEEGEESLPRVPIGTSLLRRYREDPDSRTQAIASAIASILEGRATYFELEHRANRDSRSSFLTSVAALRGEGAGAVLIHRVVAAEQPHDDLPSDVRAQNGAPSNTDIERLTPREREVLDRMAAGLDNRAIAAQLGIQYTTVRGHVRSVIEKLGARSRLEAVARAYQNGLVPM